MLLASLALATTLLAQPVAAGASATLVEPREARMNLDGRSWSCDSAGQCIGRGGGNTQPLMRECRRFVARFGAVSAFSRNGLALTEAELGQCNAAAA